MNTKMLAVLFLFLASCGDDENYDVQEPVAGVYDVRSEVFEVVCNAQSNTPTISNLVVEVVENAGDYALYLCDQLGNRQVLYGTSYDGYTFHGHADIYMDSSCYFREDFDVRLSYKVENGFTTVSGTSTTTLTMNCATGSCIERSNITGTKRQGATSD